MSEIKRAKYLQDEEGNLIQFIPPLDDELSEISNNAVKNSVITAEINSLKQGVSEIEELKKSVSDGKELVANAITSKGVETEPTADFSTMATNIEAIPSGSSGGSRNEIAVYSDVPLNVKETIIIEGGTI